MRTHARTRPAAVARAAAAGAAAALALATLPGAAAAATDRHVTPTGTGPDCTEAAPCRLQRALEIFRPGDEVIVHAGRHALTNGGTDSRPVELYGAPGEARPTIDLHAISGTCGLRLGLDSIVSRLRLRVQGDHVGVCADHRVRLRQLVVTSSAAQAVGVRLRGAGGSSVVDSSIDVAAADAVGLEVADSPNVLLQNVSIMGGYRGIAAAATVTAGTSIEARSSFVDGADGAVALSCGVGEVASIATEDTAIGVVTGNCPSFDLGGTIGTAGANVAADADGVLRPGPGSTLIDRGTANAASSGQDVDGQPREIGPRPDMGADEVAYPPSASRVAVRDLAPSTVTLSAIYSSPYAEATGRFQLGTTTAYGRTFPATLGVSGGRFPVPVATAAVAGLAPETTYHVRLVMRNALGLEAEGADSTFTTPPAPVDGGGGGGGTGTGGGDGTGTRTGGDGTGPGTGAETGTGTDTGGRTDTSPAGDSAAPSCRVAVARARRAGRVVVRGRCSEPATLRLAFARRGRSAVVRTVRVRRAGRRFAVTLRVGALATPRRAVRIRAADGAGNAVALRRLRIRRR